MAIAVIITGVAVYAAYRWYTGASTIPAPTYMSGFTNPTKVPTVARDLPRKAAEKRQVSGFANPINIPDMKKLTKKTPYKNAKYADEWFSNVESAKETHDGITSEPFYSSIMKEGFGGVARGAGIPDCLRSTAEGTELISIFSNRGDKGVADLRELTQIVSKLACFKKDLVSPSFVVDSTRYQQFVTMHDIEPIAETTGRCFSKTISPRDLELAFDKWNSRGEHLVRRLSAAKQLSAEEVAKAESLFRAVIRDVKDIARGSCLQGLPMIAGKPGPRDPWPYEPPKYNEYGEYKGYY
jgi:hypothetical protein